MSMPNHLVLVRHGQSEANVIQKRIKADRGYTPPEGFYDRHDSEMVLTSLGIEQAQAAGEWLRNEFPNGFDHYHVSSLTRTLQTAGSLAINGAWEYDDRLRERDWGEYNSLTEAQQMQKFEESYRLRQQNKWYWCPPGGESLGTGVMLRWRDIRGTMIRQMGRQSFIGVTHGETMGVASLSLEHLTIPEWLAREKDQTYQTNNTQIIHWSRIDPDTGLDAGRLEWRRSVCPWDSSKSWFGGEWVKLDIDRTFSDEQLLTMVARHKPLLKHTGSIETTGEGLQA